MTLIVIFREKGGSCLGNGHASSKKQGNAGARVGWGWGQGYCQLSSAEGIGACCWEGVHEIGLETR